LCGLEYEDGLILLQQFIKKRPIVIAGSGLSISMGIPGMGQLLEYLKERLPQKIDSNELREWNDCLLIIAEKGFEEGLLEKGISDNLLLHIILETANFIESYDELFSRRLHNMSIEEFPFAVLIEHLVKSLPPSKSSVDVITTNYDHLVEYACDLIQVECCTGFKGLNFQLFKLDYLKENAYKKVAVTDKRGQNLEYRVIPKVRLLKPHGSLRWQRDGEKNFQTNKHIRGTERVIITPGSTKFKASLTDYVMNSHRELANECLNNSDSVIIIGFGFNDSHLQTVLNERLKEGMDCLILTRSLTPNAKHIIKSCRQVIALEMDEKKTKWYFNGQEGHWEEPIWDLAYFVDRVL
jgi:hypothetical protein